MSRRFMQLRFVLTIALLLSFPVVSNAQLTLTVTDSPLMVPSNTAQNFSLDLVVTNGFATSQSVSAYGFTLSITPAIPASDIKLLSVTDNILAPDLIVTRLNGSSSPAALPDFVSTQIRVNSNNTDINRTLPSVPGNGGTRLFARLNLQLQAYAARNAYQIAVVSGSGSRVLVPQPGGGISSIEVGGDSGFISTPEPGTMASLALFGAMALRRHRRK